MIYGFLPERITENIVMSLDEKKWMDQIDQYPEIKDCVRQSTTGDDARPSYQFLYERKNSIPKELYAYYFRLILKYDTAKVPVDLRVKMFDGVTWEDIMFQDEIDAIKGFEDQITIYRGTNKDEVIPGLSWTLKERVAKGYPLKISL